ncbi:hypothetical protein J7E25_08715 [Agromyces sp. ISL-38]|uniref:hypothetical protein n=1 Tax=Agromyces sp. ISL-38 TaxID=2819107 RepID=UPI001BEBBA17|nr:hypothetical protein [Agromyces sp. ISL-38]MBT2499177.1 hypothetical protein [Agromyces sp. ISL-38]MBT2518279.1 hypothetical protein [Streptomyces sp. ISL-90]
MDDRERGREVLDEIAPGILSKPDTAMSRMFNSEGLSVRGKIFAFASKTGDLVVKLPAERIDALGLDNMVMAGRPRREWAVVPLADGVDRWRAITGEAYAFVDSITP